MTTLALIAIALGFQAPVEAPRPSTLETAGWTCAAPRALEQGSGSVKVCEPPKSLGTKSATRIK